MPQHTQLFEDATAVTPLSSHSYATTLHPHWAIGAVPHGGYTLSILHRRATAHFKHTHPTRHSADTMPISMHTTFLRRTAIGPALLTVTDAKLGARTSTIHVTLSQIEPHSEQHIVKLVGYITVSDPVSDVGVSSASAWKLHPAPPAGPPVLDGDETWKVTAPNRYSKFRKVEHQTVTFGPRAPKGGPGVCDQWTRLHTVDLDLDSAHRTGNAGKWTTEAAVFLSDWYPAALAELGEASSAANTSTDGKPTAPFWYPTVTLSIDFKKRLPPDGVDWLYTRIVMKTIQNGRLDIEAVVLDEQGDVVLLGSQVALVVSAERNTRGRTHTDASL